MGSASFRRVERKREYPDLPISGCAAAEGVGTKPLMRLTLATERLA